MITEVAGLVSTGGDVASIGVLLYLIRLDRRVLRLEIKHNLLGKIPG